jgi:hypothetical protein
MCQTYLPVCLILKVTLEGGLSLTPSLSPPPPPGLCSVQPGQHAMTMLNRFLALLLWPGCLPCCSWLWCRYGWLGWTLATADSSEDWCALVTCTSAGWRGRTQDTSCLKQKCLRTAEITQKWTAVVWVWKCPPKAHVLKAWSQADGFLRGDWINRALTPSMD